MGRRILAGLRWGLSIALFFMAMTKSQLILQYGLEIYEALPRVMGWPIWLKYYGPFAVIIELSAAVLIWSQKLFIYALIPLIFLTVLGSLLSVYSIVTGLESDCGCGFFGDDEMTFLMQKLLLLGVALLLVVKHKQLFQEA